MSNVISLLPENVANQIAAGEVVQRPASVVKELLENAIDAGASQIKLIVKDAGRTLIQVVDNGSGMNPADARLCFERHATSKIKIADDLFKLTTKGFRGEALASIAAIAQVELKTRLQSETVGRQIVIEGGKLITDEDCQNPVGSSFSVKNLFFNIPARRNFLKDDSIELKHIIDEFERVALPHPGIAFSLHSNGNEVFQLPAGNLIQRLNGLFGNSLSARLVPVKEETPFMKITGYIGKPDAARKKRGNQYLFVNNRFIKSAYLNHCIYEAYRELIGSDSHPAYYVFLELAPKTIDINIHPTKTEIKFTDDRTVYALLLSTVKRALGKAGAGPSLEFNVESGFSDTYFPADKLPVQPSIQVNTDYNPFNTTGTTSSYARSENSLQNSNQKNWERLFDGFRQEENNQTDTFQQNVVQEIKTQSEDYPVFQFLNKYLITQSETGIVIIDQQRAHERVLYEHYLSSNQQRQQASQQLLFPEHVELSTNDFILVEKLLEDFKNLGFDVELFGKNNIVVNGTPADLAEFNVQQTIESILEGYKLNIIDTKLDPHDNLCRALAKSVSVKYGKSLTEAEMKLLVSNIMNCENPVYTANGKVISMEVEKEQIDKFFKR
ncbi:MAG: DNA mismatch repair endonuclease MutL [Sediminibacterium sp.]|nr:DNA mismatch repair endonuclease MutL [Sediminibacterium sp.]